jgi:hypothetical protein
MIALSLVLALVACAALLAAGYLFGLQRGQHVRAALRRNHDEQVARIAALETRILSVPPAKPDDGSRDVRAAIQDALGPLLDRERVTRSLSAISVGQTGLGELPSVVDAIMRKGGFATVVLSDASGLPLAASTAASDVELLAGTAAYFHSLAERAARTASPRPISCVVLDDASRTTVHRMFEVGDAHFTLSAVSRGTPLMPGALDAALSPIEQALAPRQAVG